jgi:hypothetical protein
MTVNARGLHDAGHLRPGVSLSKAADILWTYSSPELYELRVVRRGWSPQRFGGFVAEAMMACPSPSGLAREHASRRTQSRRRRRRCHLRYLLAA